ncbi:hypothetical protein M9Y10_027510 [Tritrichomonas musculus]|uniref:ArnT-like N-terminal domain-containing protein n=1 Tax=Tritrichomonas musculus TaxID=1915356 RepID=A0ABR2H6X3_9EUKA
MIEEQHEEDKNELPSSISKKKNIKSKPSHFSTVIEHIFPNNDHSSINLDRTDASLIMFFLGISALTRTIRIYYPKNVIYNESIYGTYLNNYLQGIFFIDNNPPFPTLLISSIAYFAGYRGKYAFQEEEVYSSMFYVMLRLIPAFFSTFCIPISYLIMRIIGVCHLGASCAAFMICSDLILIVEGRHFMIDGIVHFFSVLSILSIFLYERLETFIALLFEGICLGLAASSKITTSGIILLALFRQFPLKDVKNKRFLRNSGPSIIRCLILLQIIFTLYYLFYSIHVTILPFKDENLNNNSMIPDQIKKSLFLIDDYTKKKLIDDPLWSISSFDSIRSLSNIDWHKIRKNSPSHFSRVISLIFHNHKLNVKSSQFNSPWWTWAICLGKYVPIWNEEDGHQIGCVCNVFLWIPVFVGILCTFIISIFQCDFVSQRSEMMIGYFLSYLPFAFVPCNFSASYYLIPLFFGVFNLVLIIDDICNKKASGFIYMMLIHFSISGYFMWSPLSYGKHVGDINFLIWKKWMTK